MHLHVSDQNPVGVISIPFQDHGVSQKSPFLIIAGFQMENLEPASYGVNGTIPDVLYAYQPTYDLGHDYYNLSGARETSVANEYLSWEQSRSLNVGLELKFLKGRIFASAEYYKRFVDGLLFDREISRTTGFTSALVNMGAMENKGFEFTLDVIPVKARDFKWNLLINLSKNNNTITELENDIIGPTNIDRVGYPEGSLYLAEWAGVDTETGSPLWYHIDENTGEKVLTDDYSMATKQIIGPREPVYYGGLNSSLSYKNFSLDMLFSYGWGFYALDYCASRYTQTDGGQSYLNSETSQLDSWTPTNTDAANPIRINGITNGSQFSTRHAYDGDYFKMKNIKLSYNLPPGLLSKLSVSKCMIFIQCENIFVLTDMPNFDPEIRVNSYRYVYDFPSPRTYTGGISLNF